MTSLKDHINHNRLTLGSWVQIGDPALVEMLATGPFDWLAVDLEHTTIGIDRAGEIIRIGDLAGCPVLVRLSGHGPGQIKRVLDAGAAGLIAPMVNTADQAAAFVDAARYPPAGNRGVGLGRAQDYGVGFPAYKDRIEQELVLLCQIEHVDGLDALDDILAVDGVDGFFVGPYDLSASLGHPGEFDHPDVVAALNRIAAYAADPGVLAGIHVVEPDLDRLGHAIGAGYRFVALASDMLFFAHLLADLGPGIEAARSHA